MINKILMSVFLALFVAGCATKSKDTADTSGSGSTSTSDSVDGTLTVSEGSGVVAGSQEDLIVNVGDRVFFWI